MSITLELPPDVEASLQEQAAARGMALADYVRELVEQDALPPVPHVADDDAEGLAALIAEGEADFAAGRFKTSEQFRDGVKQRHGLDL